MRHAAAAEAIVRFVPSPAGRARSAAAAASQGKRKMYQGHQHAADRDRPAGEQPGRAAPSRDVSYVSFDVRKDDSYSGRGRVAALQSYNSSAEANTDCSGENTEFTLYLYILCTQG